MKRTEIETRIREYRENTKLESNCRDILFANTGGADLTIDGYLIAVGDAPLSINLYPGDINITEYQLVFSVGPNPKCTVIKNFEILQECQ